jgi:hypothetical protein
MRDGHGDNEERRDKRQSGNGHGGWASCFYPVGAAGVAFVVERQHGVQVYVLYVAVVQAVASLPLRRRQKDARALDRFTMWADSRLMTMFSTSRQSKHIYPTLGLSEGTRGTCFGLLRRQAAPHAFPCRTSCSGVDAPRGCLARIPDPVREARYSLRQTIGGQDADIVVPCGSNHTRMYRTLVIS